MEALPDSIRDKVFSDEHEQVILSLKCLKSVRYHLEIFH